MKRLDKFLLFIFILSLVLLIWDAYTTGKGRSSIPFMELFAAFFGGLYAGRVFSIGAMAMVSLIIFISSWLLDPFLYNLLGWSFIRERWFYVNIAVAYCLLLGAIASKQFFKNK